MKSLTKQVVVADLNDSIDSVVRRMAKKSRNVKYPGLAVVLNNQGQLEGILTDGDIRRAYARDVSFKDKVSNVMIDDPITLPVDTLAEKTLDEIRTTIEGKSRLNANWVRHILFVDKQKKVVKVVDYVELMQNASMSLKNIAVLGLGYVGLTLAVYLANQGYRLTGNDINQNLISQLQNGNPHIHEPGLADMLKVNLEHEKINFQTQLTNDHDIYILAVGTPLDSENKPDLSFIEKAVKEISKFLKLNDQIMIRSTIPVGTTRHYIIPLLEDKTGLKAGDDFSISFVPERTVEGNAINELRTLPQIVGGYSNRCLKRGSAFWSTVVSTVVQVSSLEAAELVKLANNTYRDLSFAFSNEIALLADRHNIDSFELINAANEGYPRNPIPLPSPGVGGYCLSKDPFLYGSVIEGGKNKAKLGLISREINQEAALYPIEKLKVFAKKKNYDLKNLSVVIIGIAYKGIPETTDIRASVAVKIFEELKNQVSKITGWDYVVQERILKNVGFHTNKNLQKSINESNVILILNNHPGNVISEVLQPSENGRLIFDGWRQYNANEISKIEGLTYATMGYMSEIK